MISQYFTRFEHIIVRSWQSLMVSAQSLSPATVPTNPIGFPAWCFSSVCLGHVALFIKHADDRPVRARAVLRVRDRVADCVGSCIPDWAESQPIADPVSYTHLRAHETPEHLVC